MPVGEHADAGARSGEVPVELAGVFQGKRGSYLLAFDEDLHLAVENECVIDLLTLLHADVGGELRHDLGGVEHVVAKHLADERHDERRLRRLLVLDGVLKVRHFRRDAFDGFFEFHSCLQWGSTRFRNILSAVSMRLT